MMRNYSKTIGALAAASTLVAGYAMAGSDGAATTGAADAGLQGELHVGVSSDYIWRGTEVGHGALDEAGLDLSGKAYGLAISGGAWYATLAGSRAVNATFRSDGEDRSALYNELDLYAQVSKDFGFATVNLGNICYIYPNNMKTNVDEVYLGVSRELLYGVTAGLTDYLGYSHNTYFDGATASYLQFTLAKTYKFTDSLSIDLGADLGYVTSEGTLNDAGITAALNYAFAKNAKISPYLGETWGLANKNKQYLGYERSSQFYGGVKLAVDF